MTRIGLVTALMGMGLSLASLMMQFLGAGQAVLAQLLWLHVAIAGLVLVVTIGCFSGEGTLAARLARLWTTLPGLLVRFAGLLIFVVATAELALWLVSDLTGRPIHWTQHIPSGLTVIYVVGACCCIAARRLASECPPGGLS